MRTRWFATLSTLLSLGAVLGCNTATSPPDAGNLTFTARVSPSTIRVGEVATFELRVHNPGTQAVSLQFPSGCQVLPYFAKPDGQLVEPHGGWVCTTAISYLTVGPGETFVRTTGIRGGARIQAIHTETPLAPGSYLLWGEIGVPPRVIHKSNVVGFTVVD